MFISHHTKHLIIEGVSFLFILLFVYAAVSKLLIYEHFQVQLEQSPYLNAFADLLAWGIPAIELLVASLFFLPKLKLIGLWSSFTLMVIFTTYIIIVLNFSNSIPCSCGGVIESLSWNQHLIFNTGFIVVAALGLLLVTTNKEKGRNLN